MKNCVAYQFSRYRTVGSNPTSSLLIGAFRKRHVNYVYLEVQPTADGRTIPGWPRRPALHRDSHMKNTEYTFPLGSIVATSALRGLTHRHPRLALLLNAGPHHSNSATSVSFMCAVQNHRDELTVLGVSFYVMISLDAKYSREMKTWWVRARLWVHLMLFNRQGGRPSICR